MSVRWHAVVGMHMQAAVGRGAMLGQEAFRV
jgi:hypothetical protein